MSESNRNRPARKAPYNKPPTTFSEQVNKLISRGLVIPDQSNAEFYLSQLNYYRFAAYCLPFEQDHANHRFRDNTAFDDVLNLYIFDRELRLLVLDAIERIEVSLRTQLAYHLSHNHNTAHPQLNPELFYNPIIYGASINKLEGDIPRSREDFIKHLKNKYEELQPPI
ncbi:TPA: Abi family protein, partial [Citrobacter freundii]|nr:Abi family protein [Citrobacter freundii]